MSLVTQPHLSKIWMRPVLWHSGFSHRLWHQRPMWAPVRVLVVPLCIQLRTNILEKAVENGPRAWTPAC